MGCGCFKSEEAIRSEKLLFQKKRYDTLNKLKSTFISTIQNFESQALQCTTKSKFEIITYELIKSNEELLINQDQLEQAILFTLSEANLRDSIIEEFNFNMFEKLISKFIVDKDYKTKGRLLATMKEAITISKSIILLETDELELDEQLIEFKIMHLTHDEFYRMKEHFILNLPDIVLSNLKYMNMLKMMLTQHVNLTSAIFSFYCNKVGREENEIFKDAKSNAKLLFEGLQFNPNLNNLCTLIYSSKSEYPSTIDFEKIAIKRVLEVITAAKSLKILGVLNFELNDRQRLEILTVVQQHPQIRVLIFKDRQTTRQTITDLKRCLVNSKINALFYGLNRDVEKSIISEFESITKECFNESVVLMIDFKRLSIY